MRGNDDASDEMLAGRVQRGDRVAFDVLVRRYLRPIHAVVASFLREPADAEDAVQESFLRALDNIAKYDVTRPFAPWLYQVARNVALNRAASEAKRRTEPIEGDDFASTGPAPDEALELAEIRRRVEAAIHGLPEQRRTAFRLHDVDGYSTAETAALMGLSEGTVRSHVHHARRELRAVLADSQETRR